MVSFDRFSITGESPIYLQILRYVQRGIVAGTIADGEELPSRRVLSALLGVNPNTVQKAYRLLEEEGLAVSHPGAKSYVSFTTEQLSAIRIQLTEDSARRAVESMREMGVSLEEAEALLRRLWKEEAP